MYLESKELKNNLTQLTPIVGAGRAEGGSNRQVPQVNDSMGNEGNLDSQNWISTTEEASQAATEDGQSPLELVERHLNGHYDFRFNQVSGRLEFKKKRQGSYEFLNDYKFNSIIRELMKRQIKVSKDNLKSIIHSDFTPAYNPFLQYFNNLPTWDGTIDYIQQLAETVETENDELWQRWFKKWIVAVVACATSDSITNQTAIVFVGKQGAGKTTWMQRLLPHALKGYFYSGIPNLKDKDAKIRLAECLLINLDEMGNLSRTNTERLKEIITAFGIRERRAYGHFDEIMPRRASFMGSVNNKQFLNDTTGNRRFLSVEVNEIEFNHSINMDNVYAQAKYLFENGFQYWFDSDETQEVIEHNTQFEVASYVEELILKWLEPVNVEQQLPQHKWTASEIAQYLSGKSNLLVNDANIQKVGKYMKKHNFTRVKNTGVYAYALKEKGESLQIVAA